MADGSLCDRSEEIIAGYHKLGLGLNLVLSEELGFKKLFTPVQTRLIASLLLTN
jgi:hypothetical protein